MPECKVSIKFNDDFIEKYNRVKNFEHSYQERLMKIHAMPESTDDEKADKAEELSKLEVEAIEIAELIFTDDSYDIRIMHDEIILELNSYSKHDKENDVYLFKDTFSHMYVFSYISKIYPNMLNYIQEYKILNESSTLVDFMRLK